MDTKFELVVEIENAWIELNKFLSTLNEEQMTGPIDANGWTIKDHLIHLTAWERSVAFMLRGKPRYAGLGIEEDLYLNGTDDEINAEIYRQTRDIHLDEALAQFRYNHQDFLKVLEPLSDADLQKPYRKYLPDEPGVGEGPLTYNLIVSNTVDHFREHKTWMQSMVGK